MGIAFRTGNGLRVKIGQDELREIRDEVGLITDDGALGRVIGRRKDADETRFCKWAGQSADGRKSRDVLGYEPFPFHGASDNRLPLVDMLVREDVDLLCNATEVGLGGPGVMGITGLDSEQAGLLDDLLTWEFRNGIKSAWRTECELLANYMLGDNPGIGVMKVFWVQKLVTGPQKMMVKQIAEMVDELRPTAGEWFVRAVEEERQDDVAGVMGEILADVVTEQAEFKRIASELIRDGESSFAMEFMGENHAMVKALRPWEDVFWRGSVRNIQDARIVCERAWLSVGEVLERAERDDWDEKFTKRLVGEKVFGPGAGGGMYGVTMFPSNEKNPGEVLDSTWGVKADAYDDMLEVVTVYFRGTNALGVEGVYYTTVNGGIEFAAHDGVPVGYDHGQYPFVDVQREYIRDNTLDSRGYTELAGTQQQALKLQQDMRGDRTQLNTVPPATGPMRLAGQKFSVEPGGYIEQPRLGMLEWMPLPNGGANESLAQSESIWAIVDQLMARPGKMVDPSLVQNRRQAMVNKWLSKMAEVVRMVGQLAIQYHTDDEIMEICDVEANPFRRDVVSIRSLFHVQLFVDIGDMDRELLLKKAEMFFKYVLPLDTEQEIDRGRLRDVLMARIDPALARVARRKAAESVGAEQEAEKRAFAEIAAGVEPRYVEGDANYMARLRQLDELLEANREDIERNWTPRKKELVVKRRENLAFGLQQQENAVTGRRGVQEGATAVG